MDTFRRIGADLAQGKNVEAYVLTLVGIALIVVDLVRDVSDDTKLTVIIAALVVLVFRSTTPVTQKARLDDVLAGYHEGETPPEPEGLEVGAMADTALGQGYLFPDQMTATGEEAVSGLASKPLDPHDPHYG